MTTSTQTNTSNGTHNTDTTSGETSGAGGNSGGGSGPWASYRYGALKVTIWENPSRQDNRLPYHTITMSRTYKDADDNYQEVSNFFSSDLLTLAKLIDQAHTAIYERLEQLRTARSEQQQGETQPVATQQRRNRRQR